MNLPPAFKKTRIAPTPSGFLHLGNVLSFALTAASAQLAGARLLLRIDDLDHDRVQPAYVQDIFDTLNFLEIEWQEGPRNYRSYQQEYAQVHRMQHYHAALHALKDGAHLFGCRCSRTAISQTLAQGTYPGTCRVNGPTLETNGVAWRLRTEENQNMPEAMRDFVVRKKNGLPAYQLTSVVDDLLNEVDFVVRGADLLASTKAQLYLASLLPENNFHSITFYHHQLLLDGEGKKLSKSTGASSIQYLRKQGQKPADIFSTIAQMMGFHEPVRDWKTLAACLSNISPLH